FGAVSYIADFPQRAATIISTSPALIDLVTSRISHLKYHTMWLASGGLDNNPTHETVQNFVDAFQNIGGNVRYSFFPTGGHGTWLEQWDQPFLIPYWNNAHQANPLTFFNRNKFSSEAAITARLGITGGFAQYEWQRDGVTIPGANSNEYLPKQFGSYRARFVRNGSSTWSDWSTVPAVISMDNAAPSTPGNLRVIYAARNAINLDWNDASDNESVTQYEVFVNGVKMFTTGESGITADKLASNTTYNFSVRALDLAGNTSPFSNQASATTASFANGLHYRYYEGNWNELPNFNSLTQVKSAAIANVDLELRTAGVNDFFGFVWEGYINIPTPGVYNFEIISDDGSKLYFNNVYSPSIRPLIENDGLHAPWSKAGSVNVPSAGMYPIAITFFEKYSGETMEVYWSGPNFSRQRIPNSAFVETPSDNNAPTVPNNLKVLYSGRTFVTLDWDNSTDNSAIKGYDIYVNGAKRYTSAESAITADGLDPNTAYTFTVIAQDLTGNFSGASQPVNTTTPTVASGLKYRYFEGSWDFLPNFNALTPLKTGAGPNVDLGVRTPGVNNNFALLWEGYINLPTAGTFTFELTSDDGSKLYFNSFYSPTATALVSNDGLHGAYPISASITVDKGGLYPIAITFFEKDGGEAMNVSWSGPGIPKQLIPNVAFTDPSGDGAAPSVPLNLRTLYAGRTFVNLDWDNSTDNVGVTSYDIYVDGVKKYTTNESAITANKLNASTSYIFTVKALDAAGNASASSASVAASTPANSIGLRYRYYEGSWDALPNFNALTPVKSGTTANIDLGVRTPGRNDNFGFVWEGYINIQIAGTYTFELISDDGSKLYFNSFYSPNAVPLVNLDGLHAPYPVSASVEVTSPGLYP
ncbi:MAG: PA14 domain-containing protein, partial [Chitinophagaceae bacterium]